MAHQWYVQHGGKQYGPLTSANLKKLAVEGKITQSTSVRLGDEGAWIPASRVQGLFAAVATTPTQPAGKAATPQRAQIAAPPISPPPAPLVATPLARPTLGSLGAAAKATPEPAGSMPAKILAAVALILGTLALATFWLPAFGAMGWLGIIVGGFGLVLGIAGLVISAMHQGSGLYLGIAGTSSSIVGLVLTIVFGVMFGMFSAAPAPPIAIPLPKPIAPPPQVVAAPVQVEPEPESEPEPVWTDISQSIEQGAIRASIISAKIEQVRLENADLSNMNRRPKPAPMLKLLLAIENTTPDKIVEVPGWTGAGGLVPKELEVAVEAALGKSGQGVTATAILTDNAGNTYKQTPLHMIFGAKVVPQDQSLRPGNITQTELVFPPPLETIEYLRLELPPNGFSGTEPLRFQIPKSAIQ
jgi:hypothetical protein